MLESSLLKKYQTFLFSLGIPLLKLNNTALDSLKTSVVIIPKNTEEAEKISSVVFDFSTQIGLQIKLYDFDPDGNYHKEAINYYEHTAKIFDKKIEILRSNTINPIFWLNREKQILQILPLKNTKKSIWSSLTDAESLSVKLSNIPQLFIPLSI